MRKEDFYDEISVAGRKYKIVSMKKLSKEVPDIEKVPMSIRIIMEAMVRNFDGETISETDLKNIFSRTPSNPGDFEIPFTVARVLMQDFTGVPAVVDLASMREKFKELGENPEKIEPIVPVDFVIDHSVQVDYFGTEDSIKKNSEKEFERNMERYRFLKWAQKSMRNLRIVPPSTGIVHQVNLEFLGRVVQSSEENGERTAYFDSLVGADSHTTMINGLGILGWGVGGIEAEAAMLGQPVTFLSPKVVGVNLHGKPEEGVTATDVVLTLTELLRRSNVVGKFVEFYGDGVRHLALPDRATLSNMCPEYGATCALFPVDDETISYLELTGREKEHVELVKAYMKEQGMYGVPKGIQYSEIIDLDLGQIESTIAGPKLPQQKVKLEDSQKSFLKFLEASGESHKAGKDGQVQVPLKRSTVKLNGKNIDLSDGDVVIAAITSCTNTSNPRVMVGAGLLAKKAVELGLAVGPKVKTSLAPGSRVVSQYLSKSGLQGYLDKLGFDLVGFGCTTCIGNSGPLEKSIEDSIVENDLYTVSVLSGNRNFEARIHRNVKANYLMSPPLVVAFAIAGNININMRKDPLGKGRNGKDVFLKDIWPSDSEINQAISSVLKEDLYQENYSNVYGFSELWNEMDAPEGSLYNWDSKSTYIKNPPFFEKFSSKLPGYVRNIKGLKCLAVFGDSVTTDHISPAGAISKSGPAGKYLIEKGVAPEDFNSFGSRRGNHEVMMRGTFGNNRISNKIASQIGPYTKKTKDGQDDWIFDASMSYAGEGTGSIVFAGKEYGSGSSRDWAAKGPYLLGVKAVVAETYERIHRSNLIGMGVLPLQFRNKETFDSLNIDPFSMFNLELPEKLSPHSSAKMTFTRKDGKNGSAELEIRLDTPVEVKYFNNGGILQNVMRKLL
ncbi:MAG: aconitate hydratase AcnA [Candidatus Thermoplasmatota archaeon]|nr:aconitate hydratase AcnA [Candidatus Thermoplasmatota archaeon]MCL5889514.1 aconitate hydratase AcnA [Candidatus Thermoplasmatota archaeon]